MREGSAKSVQLAHDLLGQMREQGLQPSAVTYGCVLVACARAGNADTALQLYRQACDEVRGAPPDPPLLEQGGGAAPRLPPAARRAPSRAQPPTPSSAPRTAPPPRQGVVPSDKMHDILLEACTQAGRLEDALDLVKQLARQRAALQVRDRRPLSSPPPPCFWFLLVGLAGRGPAPTAAWVCVTQDPPVPPPARRSTPSTRSSARWRRSTWTARCAC